MRKFKAITIKINSRLTVGEMRKMSKLRVMLGVWCNYVVKIIKKKPHGNSVMKQRPMNTVESSV